MKTMRWTLAALFVCVALTACRFAVLGINDGNIDMAMSGPADLAGGGGDMPACECATGCSETPAHHCLALAPSGPVVAGDYTMAGLAPYNVTANITVNTDNGAIMGPGALARAAGPGVVNGIGFHSVAQTGGPSVGVFSVAGLTLASGAKITVTGGSAFALASSGAVTIAGVVDASCGMMPGPGGFAGGMPGMDGGGPMAGAGKAGSGTGGGGAPASGGGGGGYGDTGGSGGLYTGAAANAGVVWGDLVSPTFILVGGPGGGGGGAMGAGKGGGGGGAVQIAVNDAITISGTINVGGCGGAKAGKTSGGGGGGAGGAIVIEAARVTLATSAVLAANGGGGGAGDDMSNPGSDANASTVPAPGGLATAGAGGDGGNGGASNAKPGQHFTNGRDGTIPVASANDYGGGGGGGVGRIAIRAQNPTMGGISDSSPSVTPDASDVNTASTHPTIYGAANFQ
jgi:hypothetical protein